MKLLSLILVILAFHLIACKKFNRNISEDTHSATMLSDTCDDPDADIRCSFLNMPPSLSHIMMIPGPGEKMIITGILYKADGKTPWPDVIMYAYHTDSKGL